MAHISLKFIVDRLQLTEIIVNEILILSYMFICGILKRMFLWIPCNGYMLLYFLHNRFNEYTYYNIPSENY